MADPPFSSLLPAAAIAFGSWATVGALRVYAIRRGLLDRPNDRSSHLVPTPRGGGVGITVAVLLGVLLTEPSVGDWRFLLASGGVIVVTMIGWLDDYRSLPVAPRLIAHIMAGVTLIPLALGEQPLPLALVVAAGCVFAAVAAINVANFMDGIDGLIGLQSMLFGVHLAIHGEAGGAGATLGVATAAAALGFLVWNWAPARIFLGDAGSGATAVLGLIGGILVWREGHTPFFYVFLPLVGIFLDASATLGRRLRKGHRVSQAHRTHLYQRLANEARLGHARVSAMYGGASVGAIVLAVVVPGAHALLGFIIYTTALAVIGARLDRRSPFR